MAKVSFSKLNLKINSSVSTIEVAGQEIEVKQYLPIADKLNLISDVINETADNNNFFNPVKSDLFGHLEIVKYYTNINFTEKQLEDPGKLYDILVSNGVIDKVVAAIPELEYQGLVQAIEECGQAVYTAANSARGIFDAMTTDYSALDFDASEIQKKLADPQNLSLLKNVLTELG